MWYVVVCFIYNSRLYERLDYTIQTVQQIPGVLNYLCVRYRSRPTNDILKTIPEALQKHDTCCYWLLWMTLHSYVYIYVCVYFYHVYVTHTDLWFMLLLYLLISLKHIYSETRQIWGIWKLRPAYSPESPNLGQNRWCFVPCDLEIGWMTLENNRASLLCCFKLCATFHSHWWIQTGVTVRKRPIWVKFDDF